MIYITGDIHSEPSRFSAKHLQLQDISRTATDTVIICGDFGLVWNDIQPSFYRALTIHFIGCLMNNL